MRSPPRPVAAVWRGFTRTLRRKCHVNGLDHGITVDAQCEACEEEYGGASCDEMGGAELPKHLVTRAIWDEVEYMRSMEVHVRVDERLMKDNRLKGNRHKLGHRQREQC